MKKCIVSALSTNFLPLEKKGIVLDKKDKQGKQNHWYSLNATFFIMKGYEKSNKINRICIHFKLISIR